jgi:hypothetical protein
MQRLILLPLLLLVTSLLSATPLNPAVRAEIDALLSSLEKSGCEFSRNGSWYTAAEAKRHLLRKLEYLDDKEAVQTTEQFIARGASTSSSSGKPYLVRCRDAAPIESNKWLTRQLTTLRSSGGAAGSRPR